MAKPTLYTPPKNSEELEKRKVLASALKDFAAGSSPETAKSLAAQGEKIGVSRNQISNLYNQYKKQGVTATPLSALPEAGGPPSSLATAPASPAQTPSMAKESGSVFDQQEKVAQAASAASGAFGGPNSKGASSQSQVYTPLLDKFDAMQSSPFGSTSSFGQRRSLESEGGRAMRMARKLKRQGYGKAAEQMALAGAQAKLGEPSIKTQAYREQQTASGQQTQAMDQEALDMKKKELEFKKRMLQNAQKEASSPTGFSPSTMAYFGGVQK
jgi:hypothetical protein